MLVIVYTELFMFKCSIQNVKHYKHDIQVNVNIASSKTIVLVHNVQPILEIPHENKRIT